MTPVKKAVRIILVTFLIYGVLVASHEGEFWPFSIYPMFSQAGNPWKRAIVRDVSETDRDSLWQVMTQETLAGEPVALDRLNINTNDIANYLSKTEVWTEGKLNGLRKLFDRELSHRPLLLLQARGFLTEQDSVRVQFTPFIYLSGDTTIINKSLRTE
ncbi:MAG: hypothetical protein R3281_08945 [Balneolaceae bacterium]|nr:hypothetical protein [Balneolaceae bacterium]